MANLAPIQNSLSIKLAMMLGDPPASGADDGITAAADGVIFSATERNSRLTESYLWVTSRYLAKLGVEATAQILSGIVSTQSITISSSGVDVNRDFLVPVRFIDSTNVTYVLGLKPDYDADKRLFVNNGYAIEGNKLYVYYRNSGTLSLVNAGTGTLHYIKADRKGTNGVDVDTNATPDVKINSLVHDACLLYAAWRCSMDKGSEEWVQRGASFLAQAEAKLPQ